MKANELRIGNYVIYNNNEVGEITGVQDFLFNNGKVAINQRLDIFYHTENINPIPLTEEWVLKFGFKRGGLNKLLFDKKYGTGMKFTVFSSENFEAFRLSKIPFYFIFNNIPHGLWYVHELQNLHFALTGEDLILNKDK